MSKKSALYILIAAKKKKFSYIGAYGFNDSQCETNVAILTEFLSF